MIYSVGMFRTSSPGDSISRSPNIIALWRWGEEPGYIEVLHQRASILNIKRLLLIKEDQIAQVKEFSAFLCWEDPLEEEMATDSSILAWKISWTEEPGGLQSKELQRGGQDWAWARWTLQQSVNYGLSLVAQMVKNLSALQEIRVQFLGQKDPLEEEMAIHSNILAQRIPWTEEPGGLHSHSPWGGKESDKTEWLTLKWHIINCMY